MKFIRLLILLQFFTFFISTELIAIGFGRGGFSRGGGGFGHNVGLGNNGTTNNTNAIGGFIAIFLTAVVIIFFLNFRIKFRMSLTKYTNKAGQIIFDAGRGDKFWNESLMLRHANFILHEYFRGFLKGDWGKIEMYTDKIILEKLKDKFNSLSSKSEIFQCEHIRIRASKIIHASDHENDNQDEFSIYFEGEIVMIKLNGENKKFRETKDFKHIYTFRRKNNTWILKEVIDDVVESDLYKIV